MKQAISPYTAKKSTEHLLYEVQMFFQTLVFLTKASDQVWINILLDAFAIHTRNLFDFFYPKKAKFLRKDDMAVFDFEINKRTFNKYKSKKSKLVFITRKADKQVAHLTYARNRYNSKNKPWPYVEIGREFRKTLDAFYNSLSPTQKGWENMTYLKKIIDQFSSL